MRTFKIALSVLLALQVACQNNKHSEINSTTGTNGIVGDHPLQIEETLLPESKDQALIPYEASMLNSYVDTETRKVFNDILTKSQNPTEAMYNPQLLNIKEYAHNFYQMAGAYARPEIDEVSQVSTRYKEELAKVQSEFGIQRQALENVDHVGTGLSIYAGSTGVGLVPSVAFELTKNAFVNMAERQIDNLESEAKNQATTIVVDAISKMDGKHMEALAQIDISQPEQAKRMAEDMMRDLTTRLVPSDLSQEDKTALYASLGKKIGEKTYALLVEHKSVQGIINYKQANINEYLNERMNQTEKNLVGLTRSMNAFRKETSQKLDSLFENQANIMGFIQEQSREIGNLTKGLDEVNVRTKFLGDYMFGKMSAGEQVQALQSGVYGDPNSAAVKDLLAQKESIYQREKFQADVNNLLSNVQNIAKIAGNLGVDKNLVQSISQGVAYAQVGMQAASAMMTGNYIGAALAISGVFGGGGSDSNAAVLSYLKMMDKKLDKIIELQQQTMDMIAKVSEQIQQSTIFLANRIYSVQYLQLAANETLEALLNKDLNSCYVIKTSIQREYNSRQADFLLNLTLSNQKALATCAESLEYRFYVDAMAPKYHLSTYLTVADIQRPEAQEDFYTALRDYVTSKGDGAKKVYASILDPVQNYLSLKKKLANEELSKATINAGILYERRLHPMAIIKDANLLLKLLPSLVIYQSQKAGNDLFSAASPQLGYRQYQMLVTATNWVNLAIAQENLVSGDTMLELLYQDRAELEKELKCGQADGNSKKPYCLLKASPMLRENYLLYSIRRNLDQKNQMAAAFTTAMSLHRKGEDSTFEALLGSKLPMNYDKDGKPTAFVLVGEEVSLDLVKKVAKGDLVPSRAMPHLIELRNSLISKISEMRMNGVLTEKQRRYLTYKVFSQ